MKTIDDALRCADTFDSPHSKHMSLVMLAAEVRRLRDEVNGLTGSADQASAWQEAVEDIASYMSVGVEGCDPVEAVARIKKTSDDFVRVAVQRAERAEAAIAPMVETAQNQQEEIHRLWVTFSKAAEILGLDPQKERRIPRPPSDTFTQAISRLVAERDVALAALKEAQEQEPVAYMIHEYQGTGEKRLQFQPHIPSIRDDVTGPIVTALYARPVPANLVESHQIKRDSNSLEFDGIKTATAVAVLGADDQLATLMRFYQVSDIPSLAIAQAKHIEKLQAKIPAMRNDMPRNPRGA